MRSTSTRLGVLGALLTGLTLALTGALASGGAATAATGTDLTGLKVLVTNDDSARGLDAGFGTDGKGLYELRKALCAAGADVLVVAPTLTVTSLSRSGVAPGARVSAQVQLTGTLTQRGLVQLRLARLRDDAAGCFGQDYRDAVVDMSAQGPSVATAGDGSYTVTSPAVPTAGCWTVVPELVRSITSQRALVVLMTSIDAAGASRELLSVLPQLTKRHTVVVSSVTDPTVLEASHDRADRDSVYRAG